MCGKTYKFFVWALGSDKHLCVKCVHKRPMAYLDNIDAIDLERDHDIITEEMVAQDLKDGQMNWSGSSRRMKHNPGKGGYAKAWKKVKKDTIAKFRKETAKDVTGLG